MSSAAPMTPAVERFIADARAALPNESIGAFKVRTYGGSETMSNIIVPLILQGQKTGTFAMAAEYEQDPAFAPQVGDLYVVTWFDGRPALLYRITVVEQVPFEGINHEHVQVEGPNARQVDIWRKIHWDYWGGMLRQRGLEPSMQMAVVFSRFQLLYPKPVAPPSP